MGLKVCVQIFALRDIVRANLHPYAEYDRN